MAPAAALASKAVTSIRVKGNQLIYGRQHFRCAVGKSGFSDHKKEGDGCTPLGVFPLRECWYRADRVAMLKTDLPLHVIKENDGWCDDPKSADYNRHIRIPFPLEGEGGEQHEPGEGHFYQNPSPASATLRHPLPQGERVFSYEKLWREDHVYDLIIPIGYNDDPVIPGKGSAIFMHVAHADYRPTEGCVALAKEDLLEVLKLCGSGTMIDIRKD